MCWPQGRMGPSLKWGCRDSALDLLTLSGAPCFVRLLLLWVGEEVSRDQEPSGSSWLQGAGTRGGLWRSALATSTALCGSLALSQWPSFGACGPGPICMGAINNRHTLLLCCFFTPCFPTKLRLSER